MLSRSFTKTELQLNQLKNKQLPPKKKFCYLTKQHSNIFSLLHTTRRTTTTSKTCFPSCPCGLWNLSISIRKNDKDNHIIVKPIDSFSFKSIIPFQNEVETPAKKHNKYLHHHSLLPNDTDVTSDDDDHIYTRIPRSVIFLLLIN